MRRSTRGRVFSLPIARLQIGYAFRLGSIQGLNVEGAWQPNPIEIVYVPHANRDGTLKKWEVVKNVTCFGSSGVNELREGPDNLL
jgi:hypothetical protein